MACRYREITGIHPEGYIARPMPGEAPLTSKAAPDIRTKARLLALDVEARDDLLAQARQQQCDLQREIDALTAPPADGARLSHENRQLRFNVAELTNTLETIKLAMHELRTGSGARILELERTGTRAANYVAVVTAWMDAYGLMHNEFIEGVRLLNVNKYAEARVPRVLAAPLVPKYRAVTRWVTVHLRAFLLSRYGHDLEAANVDDSTGQLAALIDHGLLPSEDAVRPLLNAHQFLNHFIPRMLAEALDECRNRASERAGMADTTVMDVITAATLSDDRSAAHRVSGQLSDPARASDGAQVHDLNEARELKWANTETVVFQLSDLTHNKMTGTDNAAELVISRLRALEARPA